MAMREHKEATTQEIPCVVASFFISWHRQVETPGQISRRSYRPLGQSKSQANRLGSSGSALVEEGGFEPPKLTQQIYSLPPLATRELLHINLSTAMVELVDGLEPPTC